MITRRHLLAGSTALLMGALMGGCEAGKAYRFKFKVEVDTPQGLRSGYSVWEVRPYKTHSIVGRQAGLDFKGEAVVIDLPGGHVLFALLTGASGDVEYAMQLPGRTLGSRLRSEPASDAQYQWRDSAELWPSHPDTVGLANTNPLPLLVRFRDPADPKSVEEVKPDALDKAFGKGFKLKRITIAETDEPLTISIEKRLGWLSEYPEPRLDPGFKPTITPTLAQEIWHGAFRWGTQR